VAAPPAKDIGYGGPLPTRVRAEKEGRLIAGHTVPAVHRARLFHSGENGACGLVLVISLVVERCLDLILPCSSCLYGQGDIIMDAL
jgi:hypothetical protein